MDKVVSYEQIQNMIKQIRSLRNGFVTNFYWDENKHPYWIADSSLLFDVKQQSIILFHHADRYSNFYYISTNIDETLRHFSEVEIEDDIIVDIVTKDTDKDTIDKFECCGFEEYKHLFRMTHAGMMSNENWTEEQTVMLADKDDINAINKALFSGFDPLAEQLPSKQELSDYIDRNEIFIVKDKESICGFIIFEIVGVTWYLRYWYVSPDFRNLGVGAKLLKASLLKGKETKRQILWVISHNENAIKRYEHYGFKRELMNDYVLIKRK